VLVARIPTKQLSRNLLVDILHSPFDALAQIAATVAIAQFQRLVNASGNAGGYCRPAHGPIFQNNLETLSEKDKKCYAGVEALKFGRGGLASISRVLG
jgi:hypothetical protein